MKYSKQNFNSAARIFLHLTFLPLIAAVVSLPLAFGADNVKLDPSLSKVEKRDLQKRITVSGGVVPKRKVTVSAPYNGYVEKFYVKLGDTVKANQSVVSVVPSLSRSSADETFPLKAPFYGVVSQVLVSEGEFINVVKDASILRIDDLSQLWILANIPEIFISQLKAGQDVVIKANAIPNQTYKGIIREISMAAKDQGSNWNAQNKVEFGVRIEILNKDEKILPGMSTLIDVVVGKSDHALSLRHEFVQRTSDGYQITAADGKTKKIEVGIQTEEFFEIKSGVTEGEVVKMIDFFSNSDLK